MSKEKTAKEVAHILSEISFGQSCLNLKWMFECKEIEDGFLIRASFERPDVYKNGEIGIGYGRWMHTPKDSSRSAIVKTAWLCVSLIVTHELMESFNFKGCAIFSPHKSVRDLALPKELK